MTNALVLHHRHIEIDAGVISGADNPADIGQSLFMVLLVEANGSYAMLWGAETAWTPAASQVKWRRTSACR